MSEIAIIQSRKSKLKSEALQGNKSAQTALNLANDPDKFLSTIQIGITLIGIITGVYSGDALSVYLSPVFESLGMSASLAKPLSTVLIVVIVTYLTIVFGELIPKRIGLSASEKTAKIVSPFMKFLSIIASPFVWILSKSTGLFFKLLRIDSGESKITEEEIKSIIQEGTDEGEVQEIEQDIVERVFSLGDREVESIMTHRSEIVWIDVNMDKEKIREKIEENLYEVYPVSDGELDNILGVILLKDLFVKINDEDFKIREYIRKVPFFHENMEVYTALENMREEQVHCALIYDEFGSIQGIVTFKDILEALVGILPDKHEEPDIVQRSENEWFVDGQMSFYDFLDFFELEDLYADNDYNTISGLILDELQHLPETGEKLEWGIFKFEIIDMDGARIDKILVSRK